MATVGHVAVGLAAARAYNDGRQPRWPVAAAWSALALLPDADVIGFPLGIHYEAPLGHRGATHSIVFALAAGLVVLALGIAHAMMAANLRPAAAAGRAGAQINGWTAGLTEYAPEQVEKVTGVSASRITRLARELAGRPPAVAIVGGPPLAHTNGLFTALAVNALNALLGSVADGLRLEAELQGSLVGKPNQLEAVRANLEKREPKFRDPS
jgi:hypothetical protein